MSSILRALRTLPIYVVTGKTKYNAFDADAAVPSQDTGTLNDSLNAGGALGVTQITDITGLVAWKDYIPVQEEAGRTVPYSYDANGYFPIKKVSGDIFAPAETAQTWDPANKGANVTLSGGNIIASLNGAQNRAYSTGSKTAGKWYWEIVVGVQTNAQGYIGLGTGDPVGTGPLSGWPCQYRDGSWNGLGGTAGSAWVEGDVIGFTFDFSTGIIAAYKNGVANGTRTYGVWGATASFILATDNWGFAGPYVFTIRTTSAEFSYSIPSGFSAWGT